VQPRFKQGKVWFPKPELIAGYPLLVALLEEMVNELSKFTLAGGVKALKHDDCIDLLNQLSEMDVYAPDNGDEGDGSRTIVTEDGLMWNAIWGDDDWEERGSKNGSTVF
jgi:hypothetical protein